ncbi:MAG: rhomboid family intramembrane serine protease [Ectothiorhodospiraceae bacterium]|nr:rhomboid family intramembrane serine protease [Ectothiorhodospiraceae bacterium]
MLFIPFKVDINLRSFPFLTILISIACIVIYFQQVASNKALEKSLVSFCHGQSTDSTFALVLEKIQGERSLSACAELIYTIFSSADAKQEIAAFTDKADRIDAFPADYSRRYINENLSEKYAVFEKFNRVRNLTALLMYSPDSYNVKNMITAAFAHGSWSHVFGNLFFFFAFAAAVELALGFFTFILVFLALAIGTHFAYSFSLFGVADAIPTLGLSGVVMGMMGMFAYLMPTVKIRCFWWFIIFVRIFRIPAWLLAGWYIGWDIYNLNHSDSQSNINFVAHISGAGIGFFMGLIFFRKRKAEIKRDIVAHRV